MLKILWQWFKIHIYAHSKAFAKGLLGGTIAGGSYLFSQPLLAVPIWAAYLVKLAGTGGIALVTGIGSALAADIYRHKIKKHIVKPKDHVKKTQETKTDSKTG